MATNPSGYREPMFNAPFAVTALTAAIVLAWLAQTFLLPREQTVLLALSSAGIRDGYWYELVTHIFLHGGIGHVAMNAIGAFAFGAPIVRFLGPRNGDIGLFYIFFLVCGAAGGLAYLAVSWDKVALLMGASGAVSGLWGGASRLMGRRGGLEPILDRAVLTQAAAFAGVNILIGLLAPLVGINIGWQAHLGGYLAGLLLIGVFGRLAGRVRQGSRVR